MDLNFTRSTQSQGAYVVLFHERLLMADILAKRGILTSSSCILCGAHSEIAAHIFLHCPFTLDLWGPERNSQALSSWPSSIANLWGDWRLGYIPNNEVSRWDCADNAII